MEKTLQSNFGNHLHLWKGLLKSNTTERRRKVSNLAIQPEA